MGKSNQITEGVIWKQLLVYFFPLLLGSFFQQLYNTVDAVIVGRFVGPVALAAVGGSSAMVVQLFVEFFVGISAGASVTIAQLYGAKDGERVSRAVHTAMAVAVLGGIAFMVICLTAAPWAIRLLKTPENIVDSSVLYLRIFFCGMVPNLVYNMGAAILRAVGDSRRPLYVLIISCVVNIILDVLFVVVMKMGVPGAALATIVSQTVSAWIVIRILSRSADVYKLHLRQIRLHRDMFSRIIRLGLPTGIEGSLYMISNFMVQASINRFGTNIVSAWAAYGKLDAVYWMVLQALGISVTTFVGQNFGAGKYGRIRRSVGAGLLMALIFALGMTFTLFGFGKYLFMLFTADHEVAAAGVDMMRYLVRFYAIYVCVEIFSAALRGMGDTLPPMLIIFFGTCVLRIVWLLLVFPHLHTIHAIEAVYPVTWSVTSVIMVTYYFTRRRRWMKTAG